MMDHIHPLPRQADDDVHPEGTLSSPSFVRIDVDGATHEWRWNGHVVPVASGEDTVVDRARPFLFSRSSGRPTPGKLDATSGLSYRPE